MDNPATERKIKSWGTAMQLEDRERREANRRTEKEIKKKREKEKEQKGSGKGCRTSRVERRAMLEGRERDGERVERAKREQEATRRRRQEDEGEGEGGDRGLGRLAAGAAICMRPRPQACFIL